MSTAIKKEFVLIFKLLFRRSQPSAGTGGRLPPSASGAGYPLRYRCRGPMYLGHGFRQPNFVPKFGWRQSWASAPTKGGEAPRCRQASLALQPGAKAPLPHLTPPSNRRRWRPGSPSGPPGPPPPGGRSFRRRRRCSQRAPPSRGRPWGRASSCPRDCSRRGHSP